MSREGGARLHVSPVSVGGHGASPAAALSRLFPSLSLHLRLTYYDSRPHLPKRGFTQRMPRPMGHAHDCVRTKNRLDAAIWSMVSWLFRNAATTVSTTDFLQILYTS
ncbi:hypothetical protein TGRUB_429110 [Toxoplasma gondii RUB]|uniref:Uncharacterized protein n=1 Tax=Toxoplasma gondii RUB TaxID=935652 RepID=A0A086M8K0_TOXGO|nr:hypothetical protein TGRUB_429110 [Toxoplasma gondii RUB]